MTLDDKLLKWLSGHDTGLSSRFLMAWMERDTAILAIDGLTWSKDDEQTAAFRSSADDRLTDPSDPPTLDLGLVDNKASWEDFRRSLANLDAVRNGEEAES